MSVESILILSIAMPLIALGIGISVAKLIDWLVDRLVGRQFPDDEEDKECPAADSYDKDPALSDSFYFDLHKSMEEGDWWYGSIPGSDNRLWLVSKITGYWAFLLPIGDPKDNAVTLRSDWRDDPLNLIKRGDKFFPFNPE